LTARRDFAFNITGSGPDQRARSGLLRTAHGEISTSVFMPVGTAGSVKAMTWESLWATGTRLILGNTYHLYLRPGHRRIAELGGLHRFQGWEGAILTDSAGFQVFSLSALNKVSDEGVEFRSHLDGSRHFFSPELSMDVQLALGADIIMAFDHCLPYGAEQAEVAAAVVRTTQWAQRCCTHLQHDERDGTCGVLFGIMQGGIIAEERTRSAAGLRALDLPGYAIGGLSVGEPVDAMREMTSVAADLLPPEKPRYLMGVGFPDDILSAVGCGVDMFDCVLPTRMGRNGTVMTPTGRLVIKNSSYASDTLPIDPECDCPVCQRHSRAYLRHLFQAREILGPILATTHNLHFYQTFMAEIRRALRGGRFPVFAKDFSSRWEAGERERRAAIGRAGH